MEWIIDNVVWVVAGCAVVAFLSIWSLLWWSVDPEE